jgi:hypothetical protein
MFGLFEGWPLLKVTNIHSRTLPKSMAEVSRLLETLATDSDALWPKEKWHPMRFKEGVRVGSRGGHGPIRYSVKEIVPGKGIEFQFEKPSGFHGVHGFILEEQTESTTLLSHYIRMKTTGKSILSWGLVYRPLHNALIEDCLTKAERSLELESKRKKWNLWVRFLRKILS